MNYLELKQLIRTKEALIELLQENCDRGRGDWGALKQELQDVIRLKNSLFDLLEERGNKIYAGYQQTKEKLEKLAPALESDTSPIVREAVLLLSQSQREFTTNLANIQDEMQLIVTDVKRYSDWLDKYVSG